MHHPKADTGTLHVKRKGGKDLLQIEATYKAEVMNTAEYMNTKYADQFVSIVKGHKSNQSNTNLTIKTVAKIADELN